MEVAKEICSFCETEYKISYDERRASGWPKFCPFCGEPYTVKNESDDD